MTFKMSDRLALSDFGSTGTKMAEERRDKLCIFDDGMLAAARRRVGTQEERVAARFYARLRVTA